MHVKVFLKLIQNPDLGIIFVFHFMFLKHIFSPIDSDVYSLSSSPLKGENISKEVNENRKDEKGNNCRSNFIEFLDEL